MREDEELDDIIDFAFGNDSDARGHLTFHTTSGNHTPSTKPILPERVTLPSGNEISIIRG